MRREPIERRAPSAREGRERQRKGREGAALGGVSSGETHELVAAGYVCRGICIAALVSARGALVMALLVGSSHSGRDIILRRTLMCRWACEKAEKQSRPHPHHPTLIAGLGRHALLSWGAASSDRPMGHSCTRAPEHPAHSAARSTQEDASSSELHDQQAQRTYSACRHRDGVIAYASPQVCLRAWLRTFMFTLKLACTLLAPCQADNLVWICGNRRAGAHEINPAWDLDSCRTWSGPGEDWGGPGVSAHTPGAVSDAPGVVESLLRTRADHGATARSESGPDVHK